MEPLLVAGKLDSLKTIAEYVMTAAADAGLNEKSSYKLRLAVDEIATNIITYSCEETACEGDLTLKATFDDQFLTITIEDTGVSFDPTEQLAPSDLDKPLENRQIGGLGIYLARESVDGFSYERVGNHNRSTFIMSRHQGEGQD